MAYKVVFRDEARKVFGGLDPAVRKRIGKLLDGGRGGAVEGSLFDAEVGVLWRRRILELSECLS